MHYHSGIFHNSHSNIDDLHDYCIHAESTCNEWSTLLMRLSGFGLNLRGSLGKPRHRYVHTEQEYSYKYKQPVSRGKASHAISE